MSTAEKIGSTPRNNLNQVSFASRWANAWNQFWFQPRDPSMLGLIRIFTGCLVFYSQLVWTLELESFLGTEGMLPVEYRQLLFDDYAWSHFDWIQSSAMIWFVHWLGLAVVALFTIGWWTRLTALLTAMLVISYANRATGALFGLDQIMALLCLYLTVGNSGGAFSLDRWWRTWREQRRESGQGRGVVPAEPVPLQRNVVEASFPGVGAADVLTNIATRLIQVHLCLIYFFAGLGKLQGETWWNGQAIWYSVASYEYQTLDLTWLADHMGWVSLLTFVTVFWEVTYPALIWSRLTRPIVLLIAVLTHLGIGLAMGMMTFGLVMLVANLSFVELPIRTRKHRVPAV